MAKSPHFLASLLLLGLAVPNLSAQDKRHKEWWLQHYRAISAAENPRARRASEIFETLKPLAETKPERDPQLLIIDRGGGTTVAALDDGTIILPKDAIEVCYAKRSSRDGDDLLAFVLSHELIHLASDQFRHLEFFYVRERYLTDPKMRKALDEDDPASQVGKNELMADDQGLALMTMAGFNPATVVAAGSDFFESWVQSTPERFSVSSTEYPSPAARAGAVQARLQETADKLAFFELGVRFYEVGAYGDAISLFEVFSRLFPEPAVLNNLGLCHFQEAAKILADCDASLALRFKLPTVVDPDSLAKGVRRGSQSGCYQTPSFVRHKVLARSYFDRAIHGNRDYYPARLNLTSLLVLAGDGAGALSSSGEILEKRPEDAEIKALSAIAIHLYDQQDSTVDTAEAGLKKIRAVAEQNPGSATIAYNRARLELEAGDAAAAKPFWEKYLGLEARGPYSAFARAQAGIEPKGQDPNASLGSPSKSPAKPAASNGKTEEWLAEVDAKPLKIESGRLQGKLYRGEKLRVFTVDSKAILIESALNNPISKRQILASYGPPTNVVKTTRGEFLNYRREFGFDIVHGQADTLVFFENR